MSLVRFSVSLPAFFLSHRVYRSEKERRRKRAILSLLYPSVSGPTNGREEQGRHWRNRGEYESCGEASKRERRLSRAFFLPFLLPLQQLPPLPSFVGSPACSSPFVHLPPPLSFFEVSAPTYKAIPGVPSEKSRNLRWEFRPLANLEERPRDDILARDTPGRIVENDFLDDPRTDRCVNRGR